jgi:soluble lytic murein transglycosylase-like protein
MKPVVKVPFVKRRWSWLFSILVGVGLLAHPASLLSGDVATLPTMAAASARNCPMPMQALSPAIGALAQDIARRFHVAHSAAVGITHAAFSAGRMHGVDPVLVLAVAAVESKFKSRAVNPVTGATGLMQVVPQWHQDKIVRVGGDPALLLIRPNITVGTAILAEYLNAEDGNLENALSRYLGSGGGVHYTERVHAELEHLTRVAASS